MHFYQMKYVKNIINRKLGKGLEDEENPCFYVKARWDLIK